MTWTFINFRENIKKLYIILLRSFYVEKEREMHLSLHLRGRIKKKVISGKEEKKQKVRHPVRRSWSYSNFHAISWSWRRGQSVSFFSHVHRISPRITHAIHPVPLWIIANRTCRKTMDEQKADAKRDMGIACITGPITHGWILRRRTW